MMTRWIHRRTFDDQEILATSEIKIESGINKVMNTFGENVTKRSSRKRNITLVTKT